MKNTLYFGDCLNVMQDQMKSNSVDLIYLDPPFNSNRDYNTIYKDETGNPLPDQIEAFEDCWTLDTDREQAIRLLPEQMEMAGLDEAASQLWHLWMNALRYTQPRLLAYLSYMTERLLQMKPILKPTGTIYLHCDPTASHYIKVLMDAIFGHAKFRNEIVWCYRGGGVPKSDFARKHDIILRYGKGRAVTFNVDDVRIPYSVDSSERLKYKARSFRGSKTYNNYEQNPLGKHPEDWWEIQPIMPSSKERLGYSTQKPLKLMDRIIKASSNEGDVVFDPFCGCATTIEAAHALGRRWIGIDKAYFAIKRVSRRRLQERLGLEPGKDYKIDGMPRNVEQAKGKWEEDKYDFQRWVIGEVGGFPTQHRTSDGGIDGRLYFYLPTDQKPVHYIAIEVKGGKNVNISHVRELRGVLESNDRALLAGLIMMEPLSPRKTTSFINEMHKAGTLPVAGYDYPRMQMLTVQEILDGKRFDVPTEAKGVSQTRMKV